MSKAAIAAQKEKEIQTKIVADLIVHEKKYQEKIARRDQALKQKQDTAM